VATIGGFHQHAIPLAYIYKINLEQRIVADMVFVDPAFEAARMNPIAAVVCAVYLYTISPQQIEALGVAVALPVKRRPVHCCPALFPGLDVLQLDQMAAGDPTGVAIEIALHPRIAIIKAVIVNFDDSAPWQIAVYVGAGRCLEKTGYECLPVVSVGTQGIVSDPSGTHTPLLLLPLRGNLYQRWQLRCLYNIYGNCSRWNFVNDENCGSFFFVFVACSLANVKT
jgi:hypothetical protein